AVGLAQRHQGAARRLRLTQLLGRPLAGAGHAGEEAGDHLPLRGVVVLADRVELATHAGVEPEDLAAPVGQDAYHHGPAVGLVALAHEPTAALEAVEDPGHRGRM